MADVLDRLSDLSAHLRAPARDLVPVVVARIERGHEPAAERPSGRPRVLALAAAAAAVVAVVLAVPPSRHAVARWFGLGAVQVTRVPSVPETVGTALHLGRQVAVDDLAVDPPVVAPPALGAPATAFVGEPADDAVTLVWAPDEDLPTVGHTGLGALLTRFGGTVDRPLVEKQVTPTTTVTPTTVDGQNAFWITGAPHAFAYLDSRGRIRPDSTRLVGGNTLLWADGRVTYRLETGLDLDRARALAESLQPLE